MSNNATIHDGQQLKDFREAIGVKQSELAHALGDEWDQKKISRLEGKEIIDDKLMEQVAAALKVKPDVIRRFDRQRVVCNVQHNHEGSNTGATNVAINNNTCTFNSIDKLIEIIEENKKLNERLVGILQERKENK